MSCWEERTQAHPPFGWTSYLAIAYLAIPSLIFVFGWFRWPFALGLAIALLLPLYRMASTDAMRWRIPQTFPTAGVVIVAAGCLWAAFGGGSHFGFSNQDWQVRDAVLADLAFSRWPPAYDMASDHPLLLRTAFGYFLPPALIGAWLGASSLGLGVFLWTSAGIVLFFSLLPLPRKSIAQLLIALTIIVFFSGADVLGYLVNTGEFPEFPGRMEWWGPFSYSSLSGQLLWAPNHAIPTWIVTMLIYRHRTDPVVIPVILATLPLSLIWTPFAAAGVLPFAALATITVLRRDGLSTFPWWRLVPACLASVPILLFLTWDIHGINSGPAHPASGAASAMPPFPLVDYLLFAIFEFGLIVLALSANNTRNRTYLLVATVILLALPMFSYGPSNDASLRLSAPALVILAMLCIEALCAPRKPGLRLRPAALVLALALGANTALNELARVLLFRHWTPDYTVTLAEIQGGVPAPHYAGRLDPTLWRHIIKNPNPVPAGKDRQIR